MKKENKEPCEWGTFRLDNLPLGELRNKMKNKTKEIKADLLEQLILDELVDVTEDWNLDEEEAILYKGKYYYFETNKSFAKIINKIKKNFVAKGEVRETTPFYLDGFTLEIRHIEDKKMSVNKKFVSNLEGEATLDLKKLLVFKAEQMIEELLKSLE